MVATIYSTLLMGVLVLAIALWIARGRNWRAYTPQRFQGLLDDSGEPPSLDPITAFFGLFLVSSVMGGAIVLALGTGDPAMTAGAFFAPLVLSYLTAGVYLAGKGRTGSSAAGAATTAIVLFGVMMAAIIAKLLTAA